ncbi:MAG: prolyl oligopeptidase family serine peptidase [Bacteroidales bacterium]|nr:prolyl oligopeptidase family serine peptidase [Bacteroidales bacterium]
MKFFRTALLLIGSITLFTACDTHETIHEYPKAERDETAVDDYFGTKVADPYRWLENDTLAATREWIEAEKALTNEYFSHVPLRDVIKERLTQIVNYERYSVPTKRFGKYIYSKNNGLQNQSIYYMQDVNGGEPEVLIDPNKLSKDGSVSVGEISFSNNGKYVAYTVHRSGSDWIEIYVKEVATKKMLKDHIEWVKFSHAVWYKNGFFYTAYDKPEAGKEISDVNENMKICYHKLGDPQEKDVVFFEDPEHPRNFISFEITKDENYMFLYEFGDDEVGHLMWIRDLRNPNSKFVQLAFDQNYTYSPVDIIDGKMYIVTDYQAPRGKLCVVSVKDLRKATIEHWETLIPESEDVIVVAQMGAGKLIVTYDEDASNHAYVYELDGSLKHEIKLPTFGAIDISSSYDEPEIFYSFTSFTFPTAIYRYDIKSNTSKVFRAPKVYFNPKDYITEQVFYTSKDGTRVPMFITYKKGTVKNGHNPTMLYGYGGFDISLHPEFSSLRIPFIEGGGIYASANLRGGKEYGEEWHIAGTKLHKQNVFDDFIAAAEYLIDNQYTSPDFLAINGGSNGGLAVAVCVNQRPDLFRVAVPEVGVMDMLHYQKFTIGWAWASDYGTSEDSEEMFKALYAYSPLHNIQSGKDVHYPAILVTTAEHDDRVVPAHSYKYAAALQAAQTGDQPKIIRINDNAGHGGGKSMMNFIEEQADIDAFILYNMGIDF